MNFLKLFLIWACVLVSSSLFAQETPLWMRYPAISPDGKAIAFCYKGDIFVVNSEGGQARQLTTHPAYDCNPVWAPDSKSIAFTSGRDGGMDMYILPITGGTPKRLTTFTGYVTPTAFSPDGKNVIFNTNIQPDKDFGQFPFSTGQLYSVSVNGGRPEMILPFSAYDVCFTQDGKTMYYTDKKGPEDQWRKHHTSSVCRDIWSYNFETKEFKNVTNKEVEDRDPEFSADGKYMYFLSERFGSFNVCKMPVDNAKEIKQVTRFTKHPIRFLSHSDNDIFCFFYDGEIYTMKLGHQPKKVNIKIIMDNQTPEVVHKYWNKGATEIAVAPNGKEFAVVLHGDIFVANSEFGTTKRITNTGATERDINFSPDGRSIVYASERSGQWNVYITRIKNANEHSFAYSTELQEIQVTKGNEATFQPAFSPDGNEVAYLANRTEIRVTNLRSNKTRVVLPAKYNYSYADGDQSFEWSPDGRWILANFFEEDGWQHPDVCLVKADGKGEIHNLTNSGYSDVNPRWMLGGKAIIWATDRQGMRSHGSWGSQRDVYALFLDEETFEYFNMGKEDRMLAAEQKMLEKKQAEIEKQNAAKKAKKKDSKKEDKKDNKKDNKKAPQNNTTQAKAPRKGSSLPEIKLNLENLEERMMRLTINSSNLGDAVLTPDGNRLYYLAAFEGGYDLWVRDFTNGSTRILSKIGRGGRLEMSRDGKNLYLLSGGGVMIINQMNGQPRKLSYQAEFEWKPKEERVSLFNHVWQQVKDKFYDEKFKDVDWEFYKKAYERFLPHINNNFDFADVLGEMLGELNASHTGARYGAQFNRVGTANLGAFYDQNYNGDGLKISEVIARGPLDVIGNKIKAGMIIRKIDNQPIKKGENYYPLLDGKSGERVRLTIFDPKTKKEFVEVVKPIGMGTLSKLLYLRWVKQREAITDSISHGQIGYIHIEAMDSPSFRKTYSELLGKYRNRKAVIIDTRYNGGGWLHEDLIHLLTGEQYATFIPRGQKIGIDPIAQWTKPSIVLVCEANYSNAHGFPWAYKELGVGKLVGMPVPGTMTAVWWETMHNGITFGIPQVGMKDNKGRILENMELQPDIKVVNDPASTMQGKDLQLEAAIKELMKGIK